MLAVLLIKDCLSRPLINILTSFGMIRTAAASPNDGFQCGEVVAYFVATRRRTTPSVTTTTKLEI